MIETGNHVFILPNGPFSNSELDFGQMTKIQLFLPAQELLFPLWVLSSNLKLS